MIRHPHPMRLLAVLLILALGLPTPAVALRGQGPGSRQVRAGLEDRLAEPRALAVPPPSGLEEAAPFDDVPIDALTVPPRLVRVFGPERARVIYDEIRKTTTRLTLDQSPEKREALIQHLARRTYPWTPWNRVLLTPLWLYGAANLAHAMYHLLRGEPLPWWDLAEFNVTFFVISYGIAVFRGPVDGQYLGGAILLNPALDARSLRIATAHEVAHWFLPLRSHLQTAVETLRQIEDGRIDRGSAKALGTSIISYGPDLARLPDAVRRLTAPRGVRSWLEGMRRASIIEQAWTYAYGMHMGNVVFALSEGNWPVAYRTLVRMGAGQPLPAALAQARASLPPRPPPAARPEPPAAGLEETRWDPASAGEWLVLGNRAGARWLAELSTRDPTRTTVDALTWRDLGGSWLSQLRLTSQSIPIQEALAQVNNALWDPVNRGEALVLIAPDGSVGIVQQHGVPIEQHTWWQDLVNRAAADVTEEHWERVSRDRPPEAPASTAGLEEALATERALVERYRTILQQPQVADAIRATLEEIGRIRPGQVWEVVEHQGRGRGHRLARLTYPILRSGRPSLTVWDDDRKQVRPVYMTTEAGRPAALATEVFVSVAERRVRLSDLLKDLGIYQDHVTLHIDPLATEPGGTVYRTAGDHYAVARTDVAQRLYVDHRRSPWQLEMTWHFNDTVTPNSAVLQFHVHPQHRGLQHFNTMSLEDVIDTVTQLALWQRRGDAYVPELIIDHHGHAKLFIPRPGRDWGVVEAQDLPRLLAFHRQLLALQDQSQAIWEKQLAQHFLIIPIAGFERSAAGLEEDEVARGQASKLSRRALLRGVGTTATQATLGKAAPSASGPEVPLDVQMVQVQLLRWQAALQPVAEALRQRPFAEVAEREVSPGLEAVLPRGAIEIDLSESGFEVGQQVMKLHDAEEALREAFEQLSDPAALPNSFFEQLFRAPAYAYLLRRSRGRTDALKPWFKVIERFGRDDAAWARAATDTFGQVVDQLRERYSGANAPAFAGVLRQYQEDQARWLAWQTPKGLAGIRQDVSAAPAESLPRGEAKVEQLQAVEVPRLPDALSTFAARLARYARGHEIQLRLLHPVEAPATASLRARSKWLLGAWYARADDDQKPLSPRDRSALLRSNVLETVQETSMPGAGQIIRSDGNVERRITIPAGTPMDTLASWLTTGQWPLITPAAGPSTSSGPALRDVEGAGLEEAQHLTFEEAAQRLQEQGRDLPLTHLEYRLPANPFGVRSRGAIDLAKASLDEALRAVGMGYSVFFGSFAAHRRFTARIEGQVAQVVAEDGTHGSPTGAHPAPPAWTPTGDTNRREAAQVVQALRRALEPDAIIVIANELAQRSLDIHVMSAHLLSPRAGRLQGRLSDALAAFFLQYPVPTVRSLVVGRDGAWIVEQSPRVVMPLLALRAQPQAPWNDVLAQWFHATAWQRAWPAQGGAQARTAILAEALQAAVELPWLAGDRVLLPEVLREWIWRREAVIRLTLEGRPPDPLLSEEAARREDFLMVGGRPTLEAVQAAMAPGGAIAESLYPELGVPVTRLLYTMALRHRDDVTTLDLLVGLARTLPVTDQTRARMRPMRDAIEELRDAARNQTSSTTETLLNRWLDLHEALVHQALTSAPVDIAVVERADRLLVPLARRGVETLDLLERALAEDGRVRRAPNPEIMVSVTGLLFDVARVHAADLAVGHRALALAETAVRVSPPHLQYVVAQNMVEIRQIVERQDLQPPEAGLEEVMQAWGDVSTTPARETLKPLLPIFYDPETFSAIPLVAKSGLPFLVIASSETEAGRLRTLLVSLGVPRPQYEIWRLDDPEALYQDLEEAVDAAVERAEAGDLFGDGTVLKPFPVEPGATWLPTLLAGLKEIGVLPLGDLDRALKLTAQYFQFA